MYNIKGEIMDELENKQDPTKVETPVEPTAPAEPKEQPTTVVPDPKLKELETKLQEAEAIAKRHREQLAGKDKLIEEYKIKALGRNPSAAVVVEPTPDPVGEPDPVVAKVDMNETNIKQSIYINKAMMKDEFGDDTTVPFTKEAALKVEEVLDQLDPTGRSKIHPDAWRSAYRIYKGNIAEQLIKQREEAIRDEFQKKEIAKAQAHVAQVTPPVQVKVGPTLDDVISGKVQMTAKEILTNFPELRTQVSKGTLKEYGLI